VRPKSNDNDEFGTRVASYSSGSTSSISAIDGAKYCDHVTIIITASRTERRVVANFQIRALKARESSRERHFCGAL
jgi:hypothetical protein